MRLIGPNRSGADRTPDPLAQVGVLYGKRRGTVVQDLDTLQLGRIVAIVPSVSPQPLGWALRCAPVSAPGSFAFLVPPIGANVWIEFEAGDVSQPIWTGQFWSTRGAPA